MQHAHKMVGYFGIQKKKKYKLNCYSKKKKEKERKYLSPNWSPIEIVKLLEAFPLDLIIEIHNNNKLLHHNRI